ncbi:neutral zinc metallopeptidase [Microbispora sp. NEAU-D428]|uniref:neutral zinc metallopeptidase n=1 Tax=Microbispora sitophila TaxID=2771537 RepID=UPI0018696B07|nr:neutral zinc metallopeptidase [Microbispora sitophila]MBE3015197.1 neutral zinc metallopeptidase [Microbispora sitophila]
MIRISLRTPAVAATAVAAALSLTGTAGASGTDASSARPMPTGPGALTRNPLYTTGEFEFFECSELSRRPGDIDTYRIYLDNLLDCLNRTWREEFTQAGLPFSPPRVRYITKSVNMGCGQYVTSYAVSLYCPRNKTIWILLSKGQLSDPTEFGLFTVIAHEYGHYAQDRAGILYEFARQYPKLSKKRVNDLNRRIELQAECFSGAFIGSVWRSLGRDQLDWDEQLKWIVGDKWHGKAGNIRYWLKRGWYGNGPKVCNTFSAPAARTA